MYRDNLPTRWYTGYIPPKPLELMMQGFCLNCVNRRGVVLYQSPNGDAEIVLCAECVNEVMVQYPGMESWTRFDYSGGEWIDVPELSNDYLRGDR